MTADDRLRMIEDEIKDVEHMASINVMFLYAELGRTRGLICAIVGAFGIAFGFLSFSFWSPVCFASGLFSGVLSVMNYARIAKITKDIRSLDLRLKKAKKEESDDNSLRCMR